MTERVRDIRPDEVRPYSITFRVPDGASIISLDALVYSTSDDSKADLTSQIIAGQGIDGVRGRFAINGGNMSVGYFYRIAFQATLDNGETCTEFRVVACMNFLESMRLPYIQPNTRRESCLNYSDSIPFGLSIADSEFTAYRMDDAGKANLIVAILASPVAISGRKLYPQFENCDAGKTYIVTAIAISDADSTTGTEYRIAKTLILECKEQ